MIVIFAIPTIIINMTKKPRQEELILSPPTPWLCRYNLITVGSFLIMLGGSFYSNPKKNFIYFSDFESKGVILGNTADNTKPTNLILLIVIKEKPTSCKRSNFVSMKPVKTISKLTITAIFDLFIY